MSDRPALAYKILTREQKDQFLADGLFRGAPVDLADGFIHLSAGEQVGSTLDKHFAGQTDLFIAAIDLTALASEVRWEKARGNQLFPHVYANLPIGAVRALAPVARNGEGAPALPTDGEGLVSQGKDTSAP